MSSAPIALAHLLGILTASNNRPQRQELALLSDMHRHKLRLAFAETTEALGVSREEMEGELGLLMAFRLFWGLVPRRLLEGLDPNYERLAAKALMQLTQQKPDEATSHQLAVVFRRIRASKVEGREASSLDLTLRSHKAMLDLQEERCALCRYRFSETDLYSSGESDIRYTEEAYEALPDEIRLRRYYRKPVLDHIMPYYLGGDGPENWQILCHSCNSGKGEAISWVNRRGWMPPARVGDVSVLTPALRYAVLANFCAALASMSLTAKQSLRIFLRDATRMILMENLEVRAS